MRLSRFFVKPRADRRLLMLAAVLHPLVTIGLRLLPFGAIRRMLARLAAAGRRPLPVEQIERRAAQAVQTIASILPGEHCLADALVAQCLLARHGIETTLCFGIARADDARPFDGHAWLERGGTAVIGARATAYGSLASPSRCVSSPLSR